jgi:protein polybromo-1
MQLVYIIKITKSRLYIWQLYFYSGKCYFRGPWLLAPNDITHAPTKLFYKQEMFLSTVDAMHPIVAIVGKCAVLDYGEYICSKFKH